MSSCENIAIVDQHPAAIKPIEVGEASHPWEFVLGRCLTADDSARIITLTTSWKITQKSLKIHHAYSMPIGLGCKSYCKSTLMQEYHVVAADGSHSWQNVCRKDRDQLILLFHQPTND